MFPHELNPVVALQYAAAGIIGTELYLKVLGYDETQGRDILAIRRRMDAAWQASLLHV